ncbi:MAG TPA: alginate export family protein, partial [Marinagarivorans sp.]
RQLSLATVIGAACASPAFAEQADSIAQALKGGDVTLSFRMRYEDVEIANPSGTNGTADLLSLKTRLTYISQDYKGFGLGLEMDDVTHLQDFEPEGAGIADPEGTEVNQYYLSYKVAKTTAKMGRNRILLDNQRFVGGVGFRQNEQTYDSFVIQSQDVSGLTLFGSYVTGVKRIFGEASPVGEHDNKTILLNAKYTINDAIALTGYYYDIDNLSVAAMSTATIGLRATGTAAGFSYEAEFASQSESGDNPANYSANYIGLGASYKLAPVTISAGYESLGEDDGEGRFITPLATLHKFQGWTDVFLGGGTGNVGGGIDDIYFKVAGKAGPVNLAAVYHQFDVNDSDIRGFDTFGSEIGFVVSGKVAGVGLSLKYADFTADNNAVGFNDTQKLWLTAESSF